MRPRIRILVVVLFIFWGLLFARLAFIQVVPNEKLKTAQSNLYERNIVLEPRRGEILDRNGVELAASVTRYQVFADPSLIKKPRALSRKLAKVLNVRSTTLYRKLKRKNTRFVPLKGKLSRDVKKKIEAFGERGLGFLEESERIYPNSLLLGPTLGFLGKDGNGLEGLEGYYDGDLAGESKKVTIPRDAKGRPLLGDDAFMLERPEGKTLKLTIDRALQYKVEQELRNAVHEFEAESAVAIVLEPHTSEVLALATYPTYDPNKPFESTPKDRRNIAITDAYEPGSTLKTLTVAAALEMGVMKPNTKLFCENGKMKIGKRTISEADNKHKFGWLTVSEILAKSSNIGTTKIAFEIGDKDLYRYLKKYGFGDRTGLDFWGESRGILPRPPWRKIHLSNISFGHGVSATPIQVANAYAAIANGGVLNKPYLVKEMIDNKTGERTVTTPKRLNRVMSEPVARNLRFMLTTATGEDGTGMKARVPGFIVAGKTGTAQKVDPEGRGYLRGKYISSFAGFAPASDPKFVIYVSVDSPKKKYYGSEVAAPVFSRIAAFGLRESSISPNLMSKTQLITRGETRSLLKENDLSEIELKTVPDLRGLTLKEVMAKLHGGQFSIEAKGQGKVKFMTPNPGSQLTEEASIVLILDDE